MTSVAIRCSWRCPFEASTPLIFRDTTERCQVRLERYRIIICTDSYTQPFNSRAPLPSTTVAFRCIVAIAGSALWVDVRWLPIHVTESAIANLVAEVHLIEHPHVGMSPPASKGTISTWITRDQGLPLPEAIRIGYLCRIVPPLVVGRVACSCSGETHHSPRYKRPGDSAWL